MRRLTRGDARSLVELLTLALARRDPGALLEAASVQWGGGRLAAAAARCGEALHAGGPLSEALAGRLPASPLAALAAGERRGDPAGGLERASAALGRGERVHRSVLAPAAYPFAVLSVAGVSAVLLTLFAAPSIQQLRVELAALAGRPEPGGLVALAAAHPVACVALGVALALTPLLMPLLLAALPRTSWGAAFALRLPLVGRALRLRASADLLDSLGDLVAGGVPHDQAWALAVETVGVRPLRKRLRELTPAAAAGDPWQELLIEAQLPRSVARALVPERVREDGGVAVLRETAATADERHGRLVGLAGRFLAFGAGASGLAVAAGLLAAVLMPLLGAGGF